MSGHDDCPVNLILPAALSTLDHIHTYHDEREITSYIGKDNAKTDIYIVSGSAREKFRELLYSINQKCCADVSELDRLFKLKPSRKGSAKRTAQNSSPQPKAPK